MESTSPSGRSARESGEVIAQLVSVIVLVGAVLIGTAAFLSFLGAECAAGRPQLTPVFVCFPGR
jgi:hypothetical protein